MDDQRAREEALRFALETFPERTITMEAVVARAEVLRRFLMGENDADD